MKVATLTMNPALDMTVQVERFTTNAVNRARSMRVDAGGKGVNVATYLSLLGFQTVATGLLGDENATAHERHFAEHTIEDRLLRLRGLTRVGVKIVDQAQEETTDINLPGLTPSGEALCQLLDEIDRLAAECAWFALSGSLPPGVSAGFYAECTARIQARGCQVALDTSGEALKQGVRACPQVLKPNQRELEDLLGRKLAGELEILHAARALAAGGVSLVVVSLGERGALFVEAEQALRALPPAVRVQSTVAAGDAVLAGVLAARMRGLDLEATARLATALAVAKLGFIGARLPASEEIEAIGDLVEVRKA